MGSQWLLISLVVRTLVSEMRRWWVKEEKKMVLTSSGAKGVEYPTRFFARDYAGNRLEFSL